MAAAAAPDPYDVLKYWSQAAPYTHLGRLEARARLLGLDPAPAATARVLELGCGDGTNLLAMRLAWPEAQLVGLDAAAAPIARGRARSRALDLPVELLRGRVETLTTEGEWDYIIAHGLLSWVPRSVQTAILRLIGDKLAPGGVAYLSYNALPGWSTAQALRELLLPALAGEPDPLARARSARALMDWAADAVPAESPWGAALRAEADKHKQYPDWLIAHDLLAPVATPLYFRELVELAAANGLTPLTEAELHLSLLGVFPPDVVGVLQQLGDQLLVESAMDVLRRRRFRRTLLVRSNAQPTRQPDPALAHDLWFAADHSPQVPGAVPSVVPSPVGEVTVENPLVAAALDVLEERRPRALSFAELHQAASQRAPGTELELARSLLDLGMYGVVDLLTGPLPVSTDTSAPQTSPLAHAQLADGQEGLTTLAHQVVYPSEEDRALLLLLDGRPRAEVAAELAVDEAALVPRLQALAREGWLWGG